MLILIIEDICELLRFSL